MQCIDPMQIAGDDLNGNEDRDERYRHRHHRLRFGHVTCALQMPGGNAEHCERRCQIEPRYRVHEAIRKRWIENDRKPIGWHETAVDRLVTRWRLHPAVGGENPERGKQRTGSDHDRCKQMRPWWHTLASEKQNAE